MAGWSHRDVSAALRATQAALAVTARPPCPRRSRLPLVSIPLASGKVSTTPLVGWGGVRGGTEGARATAPGDSRSSLLALGHVATVRNGRTPSRYTGGGDTEGMRQTDNTDPREARTSMRQTDNTTERPADSAQATPRPGERPEHHASVGNRRGPREADRAATYGLLRGETPATGRELGTATDAR